MVDIKYSQKELEQLFLNINPECNFQKIYDYILAMHFKKKHILFAINKLNKLQEYQFNDSVNWDETFTEIKILSEYIVTTIIGMSDVLAMIIYYTYAPNPTENKVYFSSYAGNNKKNAELSLRNQKLANKITSVYNSFEYSSVRKLNNFIKHHSIINESATFNLKEIWSLQISVNPDEQCFSLNELLDRVDCIYHYLIICFSLLLNDGN